MLQVTPKQILTGLAICLWVAASIGALIYDASRRLTDFDPNGQLLYASMDGEFDQAIAEKFTRFHGDLANQIFHIQAGQCDCNLANDRHIAELTQAIRKLGLHSNRISATQAKAANLPLDAFPAVVAFNSEGELAYLGPYSSGLFCAGNNRLLDKYLPGFTRASGSPIVITDSQGCYCQSST